jgi:hypothetical protein
MKIKFTNIPAFSIAVFCTCFVLSASAQEEGSSLNEFQDLNQNPELNLDEDKTLIFESESKPAKRDTVASRPSLKPAVKSKSTDKIKQVNGKEDDDALSFNFLYYIIQKFKYSDLLDQ